MAASKPPRSRLVAQLGRQTTCPFVGRSTELGWLNELLEEARHGDPRVVFVRGEPGAGKSRLSLELLESADGGGWQTIKGRCLQHATQALSPFVAELLPRMIQAGLMRDDPADRHAALLSDALRSGNSNRLPAVSSDAAALGSALAQKVAQLANRRPLLVVVDDVQWLQGGALSLFNHLVLSLSDIARGGRLPLLLVATLRDTEDDLPAAEVVARLLREPISRRLELGGLGEAEANELVSRVTGARCDPLLLDVLFSATRGNPLFLAEALRQLAARGVITERQGILESTVNIERLDLPASAPAAFRDAISRLPPGTLPVLELAAVLGEELSSASLAVVSSTDTAEAIDLAVKAGLMTVNGDRAQFSHALIRQALLEALGPVKRARMHGSIAQALIERFGDGTDRALEIASHLVASDDGGDRDEVCALFERAGDAAMAEFSWGLGARYFHQALNRPHYLEGLDARARGVLGSKAARAFDNIGDGHRAREAYAQAMPWLKQANAHREWGNAILGWERTFTNAGEPIPDSRPYDEFREVVGEGTEDVRAALLCQWAESLWITRDPRDVQAAERALEVSIRIDDPQVKALAHTTVGLVRMRHLQPDAALAAFSEATQETSGIANPRVRGWGRARKAIQLVMLGRLGEARRAAEAALAESESGNDWPHSALNLAMLTVVNSLLGELPALQPAQANAAIMVNRSRNVQARFLRDGAVARTRLLRGELDEAADALASWLPAAGRSAVRPSALLVQAAADGVEAARTELRRLPPHLSYASSVDFSTLGTVCGWVEVADSLSMPELAESMEAPLEAVLASGVKFSVAPPYLIPRVLGAAARLAGHYPRAEDHLHHALEVAKRAGARPELGLTHLEWARLVAARDSADTTTIGDHLKSALEAFHHLGMTRPASEARELARSHGVALGGFRFAVETDELSVTEAEVLQEFRRGLSVTQIAAQLLISERTAERNLDRLRSRLGISSRAEAESFLSRQEADWTQRPTAGSSATHPPKSSGLVLSPRETEVIGLIALGRTNQQIAEELVISLHTVARHVANIFDKTGASNRTEAARLANTHGATLSSP